MKPKDQLTRLETKLLLRKIHSDSEFISFINNEIRDHILAGWSLTFRDRTSHHVFDYFLLERWVDPKELEQENQPQDLTIDDQQ